ncbi:hypothetical protein [uncultured Flavonifractor sp.]|nr:hypothetical protein [uncultured Flavonifractor sp.]
MGAGDIIEAYLMERRGVCDDEMEQIEGSSETIKSDPFRPQVI